MVNFIFPGFNRRYAIIAMLAAIALVLIGFGFTEYRRSYTLGLATGIHDRQERLRELAEMIYAVADAESAHRGFMLTLDPEFLVTLDDAKRRANSTIESLLSQYGKTDKSELARLTEAKNSVDNKFAEMQTSIDDAKRVANDSAALQAIRTNLDLHWMKEVRASFEEIRSRERARVFADVDFWLMQVRMNRYVTAGTTLLNVILLLCVGMLVIWEIERRTSAALKLNTMVEERTAELSNLSKHMLNVREDEKLRLARELHDELGGILIAIKIDLAQLAKKYDFTQPDAQVRWQRIQNALTAGIELKRRVIEELRPTLLDNLGLKAAVKWQCEETCSQAGLGLEMDFPEEEISVDLNIAIAIFRVAQEAMTNIIKHARATAVKVHLKDSGTEITLSVEDNGVGFDNVTRKLGGSHGLLSMKYRMQTIGGTFELLPVSPHGTRVLVRLPISPSNRVVVTD